jgi:hypothetical protein
MEELLKLQEEEIKSGELAEKVFDGAETGYVTLLCTVYYTLPHLFATVAVSAFRGQPRK